MTKFKFPIFLSAPDALSWTDNPQWSTMLMVESEKDAARFILGVRKEIVPVYLVEMRCQYKTRREFINACALAKMFIHIEPHEPPDVWNAGKWEIGIEAYVGGTRALEYPDREKYKRMGIIL